MLRSGLKRSGSHNNLLFSRSISAESINSHENENGPNYDQTNAKVLSKKSLSCLIMHSFAAVGFTVSPITIFLQLYSIDYYERQGAYLPVLAYFITLTRGIDVIFSPIMSNLSDITVTPWGRRRPYLFFGSAPCAIALMMLLFPPYDMVSSVSSSSISFWYGGTYLVFSLLQSVVVAPYEALGPELSKDKRDRRRLFWLTVIYDAFGGLLCASLPLLLDTGIKWLPKGACSRRNTTASCDMLNNRIRFGVLGFGFAILMVSTNMLLAFFVKEPKVGEEKLKKSQGLILGGLATFAVRSAPPRLAPLGETMEEEEDDDDYDDDSEEDDDDYDDDSEEDSEDSGDGTQNNESGHRLREKSFPRNLNQSKAEGYEVRWRPPSYESSPLGFDYEEDEFQQQELNVWGPKNDLNKCIEPIELQDEESFLPRPSLLSSPRRFLRERKGRKKLKQAAIDAQAKAEEDGILTVPLVPVILSIMRNRAFSALLPAWVCDSMASAMTMSMLVFYVRYVIQPEQQTLADSGIECKAYFYESYRANNNVVVDSPTMFNDDNPPWRPGPYDEIPWRCKSPSVLSAMACSMLIGSFVGGPLWTCIARRIETRNAWLLWSTIVAINHLLLGFADNLTLFMFKGDVLLAVIFAFFVGMPYGARHLNDNIVADIMDYDEFITGMRNENFFTMSKSFLPRLVAAPAAAIPLALLGAFGHRPPVDGSIMAQSNLVVNYCRFVTIYAPATLSLISLLFKTRYPLRTKEQLQLVREGIKLNRMSSSLNDGKSMTANQQHLNHISSLNSVNSMSAVAASSPSPNQFLNHHRANSPMSFGVSPPSPHSMMVSPTPLQQLQQLQQLQDQHDEHCMTSPSSPFIAMTTQPAQYPNHPSSAFSAFSQPSHSSSTTSVSPVPLLRPVASSSLMGLSTTTASPATVGAQHHIAQATPSPVPPPLTFFATDPITLKPYRPLLTGLTPSEQRLLFTLLTFPQVKVLKDLRANGPGGLVRRMAFYSLFSGGFSLALFFLSIWSLRFLRTERQFTNLSVVATLITTLFGYSMIMTVYAYMRHQTAKALMKSDDVSFRLLDIAIAQMQLQDTIRNARIRYKVRVSRSRKKSKKKKKKLDKNKKAQEHKNKKKKSDIRSNNWLGIFIKPLSQTSQGYISVKNNDQEDIDPDLQKRKVIQRHKISGDSINMARPFRIDSSNDIGQGAVGSPKEEEEEEEEDSADEEFDFAPRFIRDNLCYQCSLNPVWYLTLAWRTAQFTSFCVIGVGFYLCVMYHTPKHGHLVPVASYITLWNGFMAVCFCFWPSHAVHNLKTRNDRHPQDLGFLMGAMFVFSNLTILLSKLLHSTADQPVTHWEDKTPLNSAAVVTFLLGCCLLSVVLLLFVFLSDFAADEEDSEDDETDDFNKQESKRNKTVEEHDDADDDDDDDSDSDEEDDNDEDEDDDDDEEFNSFGSGISDDDDEGTDDDIESVVNRGQYVLDKRSSSHRSSFEEDDDVGRKLYETFQHSGSLETQQDDDTKGSMQPNTTENIKDELFEDAVTDIEQFIEDVSSSSSLSAARSSEVKTEINQKPIVGPKEEDGQEDGKEIDHTSSSLEHWQKWTQDD